MIEILILYVLFNREKTIYSIRKEIIELFGTFTKPSLGTIHPALKRLGEKKYVQFSEKMSEGGKKSSYYSITENGKKHFKELFFAETSENPSLFYNQTQARFATMGILSSEYQALFLNKISKKIDLYKFEVENKLKNEYINFDFYQKELLKNTLKEINNLKNFSESLKVNNGRNN